MSPDASSTGTGEPTNLERVFFQGGKCLALQVENAVRTDQNLTAAAVDDP